MDPLTHCLVGGTVSKTLKNSRARFWIMMFLGEAPDLDVFFGHFGPWAFWLQHRGITHSFFGVTVQALFYAWLFQKVDADRYLTRVWQYSIPLFLHSLCDFLTSYGVPLFSPVTFIEYSGNLVPAVTIVPMVFMLAGLIFVSRRRLEGWSGTKPIWIAWIFYLMFSLGGRSYASHLVGPTTEKKSVVSGLANPFHWMAVIQPNDCCSYHSILVNVLNGDRTPGIVLATDMSNPVVQASLKSPDIKRFVKTTRWPIARFSSTVDGGWKVDWGKVIFSSRGFVRGLWSVNIDRNGNVGPAQHAFIFWNPD